MIILKSRQNVPDHDIMLSFVHYIHKIVATRHVIHLFLLLQLEAIQKHAWYQ